MNPIDEELVPRAVAGDESALVTLLERHAPSVRAELAPLIPIKFQAVLTLDDIMQQAYTDAFLSIRRFRPGPFRSWLSNLARCNLTDALRALSADKRGGDRKQARGPEGESFVELYEMLGGATATPSRDAARGEAKSALEVALGKLPEVQRTVIRLYDLEGRDAAAVAGEIGRTEGAMYMLRARAHRALAELMGTVSQYLTRRG